MRSNRMSTNTTPKTFGRRIVAVDVRLPPVATPHSGSRGARRSLGPDENLGESLLALCRPTVTTSSADTKTATVS